MRNVSDAFQRDIIADVRRTFPRVVIHIVDPDIVYGATTYSTTVSYSDPEEIYDNETGIYPYATFEVNRWLLDGGQMLASSGVNSGSAYASSIRSNVNSGVISSPWVQLNFSGVTLLQSCTIVFSDSYFDGIPEDFTVDILQTGGTVAHTETVTGNNKTEVKISGFSVNSPVGIKVTATKMTLGARRFRVSEIIAGIHETYTGDDLASLSIKEQVDLTLETIPFSTCIVVMDNSTRLFDPRNKEGLFNSLEDRQGIDVYIGTGDPVEYVKIGHFYMGRNGWRTSKNELSIQWELYDLIGLLYDRAFEVPQTLPTTLEGWIQEILGQFDAIFANEYEIETGYETTAVVAVDPDTLNNKTCGEMIRFLCEYVGLYPVATQDGKLRLTAFNSVGNDYSLDNLNSYPEMSGNSDVDRFDVTLNDAVFGQTHTTIGGNSTTSGNTRTIDNPFITDVSEAQAIVTRLLAYYGGNVITLNGRGNPSSELGDMDNVQLDSSNATSGRRYLQTFQFQGGVLQACESQILQGDGALSYSKYAILTSDQTWSFPAGVTEARILLVGGGYSGERGTDGTWSSAGQKGADGVGGKIYTTTISFGDGSTFAVVIGAAEGGDTTFGAYSSEDGTIYPYGYGDMLTGKVFGRTGVEAPLANSGDGGQGGAGGKKGERHSYRNKDGDLVWVVDYAPTPGRSGKAGATGCAVVFWNE